MVRSLLSPAARVSIHREKGHCAKVGILAALLAFTAVSSGVCADKPAWIRTDNTTRNAPTTPKPSQTVDGKPYSRPTDKSHAQHVFWGDTHLHTQNSFDAGLFGTRLGPADAYRFARGEEVISSSGVPAKLRRPYDFLVVTDHAEYMGMTYSLLEGPPELMNDPIGKKWYDDFHSSDPSPLFTVNGTDIMNGTHTLKNDALARSGWQRALDAAEKYNDPGRFTAFIGFEWSSTPQGDNLHRNVIFEDGADKAGQVLPASTLDSQDPEHLWKYLADYEKKTGGHALAIPHNSNLSGGLMFADKTFGGKPLDRAYAEARAKWEPVAEIAQSKGDSETLPMLSPDDDFISTERWDKTNIMGNHIDTPEQQPFNYLRPALNRGLKYEKKFGINPFKYGFVGGSDIHNALSTVDANNNFGVNYIGEPGPERLKVAPAILNPETKVGMSFVLDMQSAGITGVWAAENTRQSLFEAFRRKEVYGSTGPRMTVRVFAGWHFKPEDATRSDFADNGYANGVPMGGDLSGAQAGQAPTIVVQAAKDPDGANLDRVQVVKGWLDAKGDTHEKVYDIAWSGDRKAGADRKVPLVGNTVNVKDATYSNSIGTATLATEWTDPNFDRTERAYYYLRVIEIPTPRWTTYDTVRFGGTLPDSVPATVTQRTYTSPIWYTPKPAA